MNRQEAIKILSVMKAAYPNSYRGMSKEEANGTVGIWETQFADIPYFIVSIAIQKIISTNVFQPSIAEVKEKIRGMFWEAQQELPYEQGGLFLNNAENMPSEKVKMLQEIVRVSEGMRRYSSEPSVGQLMKGFENHLADGETKMIEEGKE